jgi:glutathione S-transferase
MQLVRCELGLPDERVCIDREGGGLDSPTCRALNPNGLIPVRGEDDLMRDESAAICLHRADRVSRTERCPPMGAPGDCAHVCGGRTRQALVLTPC